MYDLVGDRIQEIFDAQIVDIGVVDHEAGLIRFPYPLERGVRLHRRPIEIIGFRKLVLETASPLVVNERHGAPGREAGIRRSPESRRSLDVRPPLRGQPGFGRHSLQNLDREHAFSERDVRLCRRSREASRRARERAAVRGDPTAERRARADQRRPARPRREARDASDVRPGRRPDPGDLRRAGRRHRQCSTSDGG